MNLNHIAVAPHVQGFIKVASEGDPAFGDRRTVPEFTINSRCHEPHEAAEPKLAQHPIQAQLLKPAEGAERPADSTLKEIPIRLFFNKPENALTARYQAYAAVGNVPVCAGDGKDAKRLVNAADGTATFQDVPCTGPETCPFAATGEARCNRQVKMAVQIVGQKDPLSVFEVRTSSINSYRALRGQLMLLNARFGGLRHIPLKLSIWQASNEASAYQPFSLMQLELDAASEIEAIGQVKAARAELEAAGIDDNVDDALSPGGSEAPLWNAALEFQAVSEFYDNAPAMRRTGDQAGATTTPQRPRRVSVEDLGNAATNAFSTAVRQFSSPAPS